MLQPPAAVVHENIKLQYKAKHNSSNSHFCGDFCTSNAHHTFFLKNPLFLPHWHSKVLIFVKVWSTAATPTNKNQGRSACADLRCNSDCFESPMAVTYCLNKTRALSTERDAVARILNIAPFAHETNAQKHTHTHTHTQARTCTQHRLDDATPLLLRFANIFSAQFFFHRQKCWFTIYVINHP